MNDNINMVSTIAGSMNGIEGLNLWKYINYFLTCRPVFYHLFIHVLPLEIQLFRGEDCDTINWFTPPHCCACPNSSPGFLRLYVVILCSYLNLVKKSEYNWITIRKFTIMKRSWNSDGLQFYQYQQKEQWPLTFQIFFVHLPIKIIWSFCG
jgi:hypothetical protein